MSIRIVMLSTALICAMSAACGSDEETPVGTEESFSEITAAALWATMQQEDYTANWALWPGTTALYGGNTPHGALLTTYVNELALDAITSKAGAMSAGAVIAKENYTADGTLAAVTIMQKVAGYNPDHNDWFFVKRLADGTVEAEGKVEGCQNCHGAVSGNDYIYTGSLSE